MGLAFRRWPTHTRGVDVPALRWIEPPAGPAIALLDQTRLPADETTVTCTDVHELVTAIRRLVVRGAPLLGVAGGYGVALAACRGHDVAAAAAAIEAARPTAVNLRWGAPRAQAAYQRAQAGQGPDTEREAAAAAVAEAASIAAADAAASEAMAELGLALVPEGARILTHCNTGALVSAGNGTAFAVILAAHRAGRLARLWIDETRPLLQGGRLTAYEASRAGIPHAVLADSAAGSLFAAGLVDMVLIGADRGSEHSRWRGDRGRDEAGGRGHPDRRSSRGARRDARLQPGVRHHAARADHCHRHRTRGRAARHSRYPASAGPGTWSAGRSPGRRLHGTMGLMKGRVLVVDDDAALAEMLGIVLRGEGFEPTFVSDGDKAMDMFRDTRPDLVLLDLMLPGMDGIDVCRQIRAESGVPIVMLTAKSDTVDVVLGLESGADDYIVKPFQSKVLIARVRARLRRTDDPAPEMLQIGDVSIDVAGHAVTRAGQPLNLTPLEFDLLVALARKPRQVFTREVLLEQVWGYRHAADTRLVNVHVQRLRAKIEKDPERPEIVVTVRGVGYKAGPG